MSLTQKQIQQVINPQCPVRPSELPHPNATEHDKQIVLAVARGRHPHCIKLLGRAAYCAGCQREVALRR